jgi:hypothetical protein
MATLTTGNPLPVVTRTTTGSPFPVDRSDHRKSEHDHRKPSARPPETHFRPSSLYTKSVFTIPIFDIGSAFASRAADDEEKTKSAATRKPA